MCAIAGIINSINDNRISQMLSIMNHRGPDFSKYIKFGNAMLGHNRLSIIDVHQRANQPMISNNGKFAIVFNGEIYNYVELKNKLKNFYNFKTKSDTEVLLAAYQKWGIDCLDQLNGAFAFCIYDKEKNKAFLARDRFGQKPIFFWKNNSILSFASEIKAFKALGYKFEADLTTWNAYLLKAEVDNTRETFFKDIIQMLPGEYAVLDQNKKIYFKRWYNLEEKINNIPRKFIKEKILELLVSAVKKCSVADVKQAISLSGGLDSNILLAIYYTNKILKIAPESFSIEFGKDFSEKSLFSISVNKFNNKNNIVNFSSKELVDLIPKGIWHLESPLGGVMNCALLKLCKTVRNKEIKILQDATGLDEIFGGYEIHHLMYLNYLKNSNIKEYNKSLDLFAKNWDCTLDQAKIKILDLENLNSKTIDGYEINNKNIFSKDFINYSNKKNKKFSFKDSLIDYMQFSKIPKNNRLKDRISMANGIELRLPFLDHKLVEYGLSLPFKSFYLLGRSKSILREAVKNLVPKEIRIHKKISIQSPQNLWLKQKVFKDYFREIIFSSSFKSRNIFDVKKTQKLWDNFIKFESQTSFFIWQILNTEEWFRIFIDKQSAKIEAAF